MQVTACVPINLNAIQGAGKRRGKTWLCFALERKSILPLYTEERGKLTCLSPAATKIPTGSTVIMVCCYTKMCLCCSIHARATMAGALCAVMLPRTVKWNLWELIFIHIVIKLKKCIIYKIQTNFNPAYHFGKCCWFCFIMYYFAQWYISLITNVFFPLNVLCMHVESYS